MKNFLEKIKNNKILRYGIAIVLCIALCIALFFGYRNDKTETVDEETSFVYDLENRLSAILSEVDGAGKVSVVITVESGMETVLATKITTTTTEHGTETVETPILVNGKTVVLKEKYPKIIGVLIVAEGAKNITVLSRLQQATVSLLDINVNQIEILTMK